VRMEDSPSPVYGAALLMRLGREALRGSNPRSSASDLGFRVWRSPLLRCCEMSGLWPWSTQSPHMNLWSAWSGGSKAILKDLGSARPELESSDDCRDRPVPTEAGLITLTQPSASSSSSLGWPRGAGLLRFRGIADRPSCRDEGNQQRMLVTIPSPTMNTPTPHDGQAASGRLLSRPACTSACRYLEAVPMPSVIEEAASPDQPKGFSAREYLHNVALRWRIQHVIGWVARDQCSAD
jgi:hypothetical protein